MKFRKIDAYWRACNYLSVGMLYLCENPLLREPLKVEHLKERLIGHWGSDPGQSFVRMQKACEILEAVLVSGRIGSHCAPETPGSIHEGDELGAVPIRRRLVSSLKISNEGPRGSTVRYCVSSMLTIRRAVRICFFCHYRNHFKIFRGRRRSCRPL
jgi:hypothetical protein